MQPAGIEPASTVLQTAAMTTSAKVAYIGVLDGERSHTIAFTEQCADHYTTNTIDGTRSRNRTYNSRVKVCCVTTTLSGNNKTGYIFSLYQKKFKVAVSILKLVATDNFEMSTYRLSSDYSASELRGCKFVLGRCSSADRLDIISRPLFGGK